MAAAIGHIQGEIQAVDLDDLQEERNRLGLPTLDPDVRNFSFAVVGGQAVTSGKKQPHASGIGIGHRREPHPRPYRYPGLCSQAH